MTTEAATIANDARRASSARTTTLDDLARLKSEDLEVLYRDGGVPADVAQLVGKPRGRMLAIRALDKTPLFKPIAAYARSSLFPWAGKAFSGGKGTNRAKLAMARFEAFKFKARIEASVIDDKPCVYLDYAGNPWFIAKMRDEIREVEPGLYCGPAMWSTGVHRAIVLFWFALDFNHAA